MKTNGIFNRSAGYSLIEMLVYAAVLVIIMTAAYFALYRCTDTSVGLRRNASDIVEAVRAGEDWRADIRQAMRPIQLATTNGEQVIAIPTARNVISYRFAENTIFRRIGDNDWSPLLQNVRASTFAPDSRRNVTAWRWELELQMRTRKFSQTPPLFTFMAVPAGGAAQ